MKVNRVKNTYNAGVIGLGNIGSLFGNSQNLVLNHSSAYKNFSKTDLVCGCSIDPKDCRNFENIYEKPAFSSINDLLECNLDVVSICTPTDLHLEHTKQCLDFGIDFIFLEKLPTSNLHDLELLIKLSKKYDTKILVNFTRRYSKTYRKLKEFFKNNEFGKVCDITVTYSNQLENNGSHMIDTVLYLLDDPTNYQIDYIENNNSQNPLFILNFDVFPKPIIFKGIDLNYHNLDIVITFENARISVLHGGFTSFIEVKKEQEYFPGYYRLDLAPNIVLPNFSVPDCFFCAIEDLISSDNRPPSSNLITAFNVQKILADIRNK